MTQLPSLQISAHLTISLTVMRLYKTVVLTPVEGISKFLPGVSASWYRLVRNVTTSTNWSARYNVMRKSIQPSAFTRTDTLASSTGTSISDEVFILHPALGACGCFDL